MEGSIKPGLYHLPLPINHPSLDKDAIKMKLNDIESDLRTRKDRAEEFAILNIIGLLNFHLKRYKDAETNFRAILSKDGRNLNALANIQFLFKKVYRTVEGERFERKLKEYLSESTEEAIRNKARCRAEQAYAYACDMHTDNAGTERFIESNGIFHTALEIGGDWIETAEKDMWKFCMAKNAHKIFDKFCFGENHLQSRDYMDTAVNHFYEITQRDPGDSEYQCESWRHLGDIFRKIKNRKHCTSSHLPDCLKKFIEDPEECMKKARDTATSDISKARILARYANFVYSLRRHTNEALRLLDESIRLDDSDYNFYAFSTRGTVRLKFFKWKIRRFKEDSKRHSQPDQSVLKHALRDMEKATEIRNASWDLLNIAEVYHLLAEHTDESNETKRGYLEREFGYLKQAEDCEDGGRQAHVKRSLGRCLFDLGHYREAIERFNEALDLQPATSQYTGYFHELFRCYLCLLRSEPKVESSLDEMAESLRQAMEKYGSSTLLKYCCGSWRAEYKQELQIFVDYCRTIPHNEGLLKLLMANEPPSPLSPPPRQGGLLKESWESPEQQAGDGVAKKDGDSDNLGHQSPDSLGASSPASPDLAGAAASLVSGIKSMTIEDTSVGEARENISNKNIEYDFFVVYSKSNDKWVHEELLPKMETRNLKGCTDRTDSLAGSLVIESDLNLMKISACILLVITDGFETECQYYMHQALMLRKRCHAIFPIRRDQSAVPVELRDVFCCFDATSDVIRWDKLAADIKRQKDTAMRALQR
ncbi:uncharacterized protein LOC110985449 [Acanthaster planci]|uniref:Uncharacterized protein LOC110985449 n=1 Tax=Acanthaster planci TaxID=133434 RepID=A0A8B7ZB17_ACAPL|nr:uncharacterized protein LOC110985449 [Acanthaster planci]XP_022102173.1 uncharacterized protein LOC110985449 [Acanthaster planci]XP_022102174.1 uncharacterized protein LOC110985449 [Acanthaster planci]